MSWVLDVKRGRPPIVPPPPETPDVIFGAKLQLWYRAGDWTLSGSDIMVLDNLEGTASRDATPRSGDPAANPGPGPLPSAVIEDGVDAIRFPGGAAGGYMQFNPGMSGLTTGEMLVVHKADFQSPPTSDDSGVHHFGASLGSARSKYTRVGTGDIRESFGLESGPALMGVPGYSITVQHLWQVVSDASAPSYTGFFSGNNTQYTDTVVYTRSFVNTAMQWGRTHPGGGIDFRWSGHGYELIFLNALATTTERNKYLTYAAFQFPSIAALTNF